MDHKKEKDSGFLCIFTVAFERLCQVRLSGYSPFRGNAPEGAILKIRLIVFLGALPRKELFPLLCNHQDIATTLHC